MYVAGIRRPCNKEEEAAVVAHFTVFIARKEVPGKAACQQFINMSSLHSTTWTDIKYKVKNLIISFKRQ